MFLSPWECSLHKTLIKPEGLITPSDKPEGSGWASNSPSQKEDARLEEETGEIKLSQVSQEAIGLETAVVKRSRFTEKIPVTGQIAQDVEGITHIVSSQAGVIVERKAEIGALVKKDDPLCVIKINGSDTLSEIKSPLTGVIIADFAKEAEKVDTVSLLYTVADLTKLLASFDVYEKDIGNVRVGQKISVSSIAFPEKTFEGKIVFISPRVDETSYTIKIRAAVDNGNYLLKLGMFVSGEIISESDEEYLTVPAHAVQTMGNDKIVFLKTQDKEFVMRKIKVKAETKEEVFIEDVLYQEENAQIKEGDEVAAEGAFLLKSELLKGELEGE